MIPRISSGIKGFDELTSTGDLDFGGIPENTSTLVYGPPKTGKSIFCYQFAYNGLLNEEPCLYLTTKFPLKQLEDNMMEFKLEINKFFENEILYMIDAGIDDSQSNSNQSETYVSSSVNNPTDIMVNVGRGTKFFFNKKYTRFRAVLDSLTELLTANDNFLIIRVLKSYTMRISESGGTNIICYTEGTSDSRIETMIKSMVDNIIRLDGKHLTIEAMKGVSIKKAPYNITDEGIALDTNLE